MSATGSDFVANLGISISSNANPTNLIVSSATIQATDQIAATVAGAANLTLGIQGAVTNAGVMTFLQSGSGNDIIGLLDAGGPTTLTNTGVIGFNTSISQIRNLGSGANTLVNNGVIAAYDSSSTTKLVYDTVPISGTGVIRVGPGYTFQSTSTVTGQTVYLQAANGVGSNVEFDNGGLGNSSPVYNFTASDQIILTTQPYNDAQVASANGRTTLTFDNSGNVVGQVTLNGTYAPSQLSFSSTTTAAGVVSFITTTVADTASTGAVYRFFDTTTGTHFFTADIGERNNVLANVKNLVEETNGFGDVVQSDPNSEAVYRFFDLKYGTHFFTASASERDSTIATRSDLTYEPNSTFYENTVALPGDVPVYRFFDQKFGTHFYTGDQNEFNGLTTQGSSTFRTDLTYEGVSFYAPAGSFK